MTRGAAMLSLCLAVGAALAAHAPMAFAAQPAAPRFADPAEELDPNNLLTPEQQAQLEALFEKIGSADFDERQKAQADIVRLGSRALGVARKFAKHDDPEIRAFADALADKILIRYNDYLPPAPALKAALSDNVRMFIGKQEPFDEALSRLSRTTGVKVLLEQKLDRIIGSDETIEHTLSGARAFERLAQPMGLATVQRGACLLMTTPDRAAELSIQEHVFDLDEFNAAERKELVPLLRDFLGPDAAAARADSSVLVRGNDAQLRIAARVLALCRGQTGRIFPRPSIAGKQAAGLFARLAQPVAAFSLTGQEPSRALIRLQSLGYPIAIGKTLDDAWKGQPPVSLDLTDLPLGFCINWLIERTRAASGGKVQFSSLRFSYDRVADKFVPVFLSDEADAVIAETVGVGDVSFLEDNADTAQQVREFLTQSTALYPGGEHGALKAAVFRGRAIVLGEECAVAYALHLLDRWRAEKKAPPCDWMEHIQELLALEIDWNGESSTGATVLPQLRTATGLNILLSAEEKGLTIGAKDAQLLPRGKHKTSELLDQLGAAADATWSVQNGAIVLKKSKQ